MKKLYGKFFQVQGETFNRWAIINENGDILNGERMANFFACIDKLDKNHLFFLDSEDIELINSWSLRHLEIRNPYKWVNQEGVSQFYAIPYRTETKVIMWYVQDEKTIYGANYRNDKAMLIYFKDWSRFSTKVELPPKDQLYENNDITDDLKSFLRAKISSIQAFNKKYPIGTRNWTINGFHWMKFKNSNKQEYQAKYKDKITIDEYHEFQKYKIGAKVYQNPDKPQELWNGSKTYDMNSMYTFIATNCPMPYDKPIYTCGEECDHKFTLLELNVNGKLKEGMIPSLAISRNLNKVTNTEWRTEFGTKGSYETLYLSQDEWLTFQSDYEWSYIDIAKKICFQTDDDGITNKYMDMLIKRKEGANSNDSDISVDKNGLNTNIGHFGGKLQENNWGYQWIDGELRLTSIPVDPNLLTIQYVPLQIAVYSYARIWIGSIIRKYREGFLECKTDSIRLVHNTEFNEPMDQHLTGYWKVEQN